MKTLIFLSQRGYQFYDLEPYSNQDEYRLVVILEKRNHEAFNEDVYMPTQ